MTAKQIVYREEARDKIRRGVDALADAVKVTLGPRGRTVIIEREFGSPVVTTEKPLFARSQSFKSGILLGIGGRIGAFGLEARYGSLMTLGQKTLSTRFFFLWGSYRF